MVDWHRYSVSVKSSSSPVFPISAIAEIQTPLVNSKRREREFYARLAMAIAITVFAGFSRTWFLRPYVPQVQLFRS